MKNLFFALAIMLVGTFAFANTSTNELENFSTIESVEMITDTQSEDFNCGFTIIWDDGDTYFEGEVDCNDWDGGDWDLFWNTILACVLS